MSNIKVNIDRPELDNEEIESRQDFKSVVNNYKNNATTTTTVTKSIFKKPGFISTVLITTTVIVATAVFYHKKSEKKAGTPALKMEKTTRPQQGEISRNVQATKKKAVIAPPLKNADVAFSNYKVNASKGGQITHKTGSRIIIPPDAFTDQWGKKVSGEVEIRYREFHDIASIFASGIPMTYDSAGRTYHFESAGMMEIRGYQNNEKIAVAPGKNLRVEMIAQNDDSRFNLYHLDEERGNWTYLGKPTIKTLRSYGEDDSRHFRPMRGEESVEARQQRMNQVSDSLERRVKTEQSIAAIDKKYQEAKQVTANMEKNERPSAPRKANENHYRFNIRFSKEEFPELTAYEHTLFEVSPENKNFTAAMYRIDWDDVQLHAGPKAGEDYYLSLKSGRDKVKLLVYPVFEGQYYEDAKKEFAKNFGSYTDKLNKRKQEEKQLQMEYENQFAEIKKQYEEQYRQWEQQREQAYAAMPTINKIYNTFVVNDFRVYNCDCPQAWPQGAEIMAKLVDKSGRPVNCSSIYLVEKGRRAMFNLNGYSSDINIKYNPGKNNVLWTVTGDRKLAMIRAEKFKTLPHSGTATVEMEILDMPLETEEDVRKALQL